MHEQRPLRRRVLPIAAGLVAVALVAATAAMALTDDASTGEPAVDRAMANVEPPPGTPDAPRPSLEPAPGSGGPTLRLSPRPGRRAVSTPYVTRKHMVCVETAKLYGRKHPGGSFSCVNVRGVRTALRDSPAALKASGGLDRKTMISQGFAKPGVVAARTTGPGKAYLSPPWRPPGTGLSPVRILITLTPLELDRNPRSITQPEVEVTLDDGSVVVVPTP